MTEIKITHRNNIEKLRMETQHTLSSHAFVSLYLWQEAMGLSVESTEDVFAVKCLKNGDNSYFFPCGKGDAVRDFIKSRMDDKGLSFCYLRECDVKWLEEAFPGMWEFRRASESDEYIGNISEYTELSGSRFSEIRRKIRKLDNEHSMSVSLISEETMENAMAVISGWYGSRENSDGQKLIDDRIAEKALKNMDSLGISGIVLYSDGTPVSVFAGFPLSSDTVDVLIGKTAPDAPRGTVYYGLREYLKTCVGTYTYCNHEEDLGISGIRQLKQSLCPVFKNEIWEATFR